MRVVAILIVLFTGLGESSAASQDDLRELILRARTIAERHGD